MNEQSPEPSHPRAGRRMFEKCLGESLTAKSRKHADTHLEISARLRELANSNQYALGIEDAE